MAVESMFYIGWGAVIVGAAILIGLIATKKTFGIHPAAIAGLGAILVIGPFAMGWAYLPAGDAEEIRIVTGDDELVYPTFEVEAAAANTTQPATLNSDHQGFTIPFIANTTQHDVYKEDNTSWMDVEVEFAITPIPFTGATQDDLATIYYELLEPNQDVDSATAGPYYTFVKTSGRRRILWHVAGSGQNEFTSGTSTMLMTGNVTMQLYLEYDEGSISRMQTEYDTLSQHVKFTNGGGWSETFTLTLIPIKIEAATTPDVW